MMPTTQTESTSGQPSWIQKADKQDIIAILEHSPIGIVINNPETLEVLYVNQNGIDLCGYTANEIKSGDDAVAKLLHDKNERQCFADKSVDLVNTGSSSGQCRIVTKSGQLKTVHINSVYLKNKCIASLWKDVTSQVNAETAIRKREALFRSFFEKTFDATLLLVDDRIIRFNPAAEKMFGCEGTRELLDTPLNHLLANQQPDGNDALSTVQQAMAATRKMTMARFEWRLQRSDGQPFPAEITMNTIHLEKIDYVCVVIRDISEWKQAQKTILEMNDQLEKRLKQRTSGLIEANEQLRQEIRNRKKVEKELEKSREELRRLSEYIQNAREEERKHIAREVHDQLGQTLSALKIDINCLGEHLPETLHQTRTMEKQIDFAIQSVRDICAELRPPILWDFGLPAAMEWYLDTFQERTGIKYFMRLEGDTQTDQKQIDLVLFRILQEALTNIMRHSNATNVTVDLAGSNRSLKLTVKDNGIGITREQLSDPRSFGIIGIRERVRFRGGKTEFKGVKNQGTTMMVTIPLDG